MNDGPIPPRLEQDASELLDRLSDLCPEASPVHLAEWREKLRRYICPLYAWSRRTNLVSEKDRLRLASHHLLPSLAMRSVLLRFHHGIVADVGSGSGLPGVPLKISLPEIPFQLIEARRRRANFLKEVTRQLNLQQVEVVNDRVEGVGVPATPQARNYRIAGHHGGTSTGTLLCGSFEARRSRAIHLGK